MYNRLIHSVILLFTAFFLLISCDKDKKNTIHIDGKIYDPNTVAFVSGADVTIAASKLSSGGIFSSGYVDIASATTGSDGVFIFDFLEDKFAGYQIRVSKSQYFNFIKELSTSEIVPGITFAPTYNIYPVCYIDLKIRNAMPNDTNDFVTYSFTSGWINGYNCCDNSVMQGHGIDYTDTIFCKTHGNQYVTLTYNVTKDGSTLLHTKTLFCNAFDTTYFNIDY